MVPPSSGQISRVCSYSGYCSLTLCFTYRTLTFFGWLSHVILLHFVMLNAVQNPICIATNGLASSAFARHYSQNLVWFLFLRVLRCFSSPRSLRYTMYSCNDHRFFTCVVPQFGNPRIEAYLQLPAAYRSLSRPSSAPDAKAFTLCSLLLELLFLVLHIAWVSQIIFYNEKAILITFFFWFFRLCFHMRPNCSLPRFSERPLIIF